MIQDVAWVVGVFVAGGLVGAVLIVIIERLFGE